MSRRCVWILPAFSLLMCASSRASDVDVTAPAWNESSSDQALPSTSAPEVSRGEFFGALGDQVSFVGAFRSWRDTLRASGTQPRRDLWNRSLAGGQTAVSLGDVQAPTLGGLRASAGTAISWRARNGASFDGGTTSRPEKLDQMLDFYDAQTSDSPLDTAPDDRASLTWLRAKPLSNQNAEVEATLLRAAREGHGDREEWTSGTFGSVNARLALPAKWRLNAAWTSAAFDGQRARSDWNAGASGSLSHPFGEAQVSVGWKETDAGFSTFSTSNPNGQSEGHAQITQNIETPLVSGVLVAATQTQTQTREVLSPAGPGDELSRDTASAKADLKIKLAPSLSLNASGNVAQTQIERAASDAGEEQLNARGDVTMEWKMSKALSLEAGAGLSQNARTDVENLENRATFRLRFARAGENYALGLQTRERGSNGQTDARLMALHVEGERRLIADWRLKANANWLLDREAAPGDTNAVARQIGAQLSFSRAARLDVRLRDGAALPSDLSGDPLGSLFSSPTFATGNREIATRFNLGSAAGSNGFGLAIEWARLGASKTPNDSWKIGLTYR